MIGSAPLKVLIVDDEDTFRLSLEIALKMSNKFQIHSCDSGESAVEALEKESFDVVILDHRMPAMSGLDVLQWMHERKIDIPVIMLTAAGSETIAVEAMRLGAYDYLRKDQIEIDRLPITINSVHERYLYRREMSRQEEQERQAVEKEKDLASLQMFQSTVSSIGEFVENGLSGLSRNLQKSELELLQMMSDKGREQCIRVFAELRQGVEVVATGVKSMLDLSSLVTQKLEGIQNLRKEEVSKKSSRA